MKWCLDSPGRHLVLFWMSGSGGSRGSGDKVRRSSWQECYYWLPMKTRRASRISMSGRHITLLLSRFWHPCPREERGTETDDGKQIGPDSDALLDASHNQEQPAEGQVHRPGIQGGPHRPLPTAAGESENRARLHGSEALPGLLGEAPRTCHPAGRSHPVPAAKGRPKYVHLPSLLFPPSA